MTVPLAAAWIGVPAGTPMSRPGCEEQSPLPRQREPNGLVIGPFTGQMNPDADGWPLALEPDAGAAERAAARCAAWIFAESAALSACRDFDSATNSLSSTLIDESVSPFYVRATVSCCCDALSSAATACC